jgi:hypothetical protein
MRSSSPSKAKVVFAAVKLMGTKCPENGVLLEGADHIIQA